MSAYVMLTYSGPSSDDIDRDPQCRCCVLNPWTSRGEPCPRRSECHGSNHRYIITLKQWTLPQY